KELSERAGGVNCDGDDASQWADANREDENQRIEDLGNASADLHEAPRQVINKNIWREIACCGEAQEECRGSSKNGRGESHRNRLGDQTKIQPKIRVPVGDGARYGLSVIAARQKQLIQFEARQDRAEIFENARKPGGQAIRIETRHVDG